MTKGKTATQLGGWLRGVNAPFVCCKNAGRKEQQPKKRWTQKYDYEMMIIIISIVRLPQFHLLVFRFFLFLLLFFHQLPPSLGSSPSNGPPLFCWARVRALQRTCIPIIWGYILFLFLCVFFDTDVYLVNVSRVCFCSKLCPYSGLCFIQSFIVAKAPQRAG